MRKSLVSLFACIAMLFLGLTANAQVDVIGSNGADNSYGSLTGAAGAFNSINAFNQTGMSITISISSDATTEDGTVSLGAGLWNTLLISPAGPRTISGTVAGPMITFDGADNVTINGLSGINSLTISNLSATATASTLRFINDATSNGVINCTILGSGTAATVGTVFFSTGTTTGNIGNSFNGCNIGPAGSNLPVNGIYSLGTSLAIPNTAIINTSNISDYFSATVVSSGINLAATGNTGWTITNNKLFQTATRIYTTAQTHNGIAVLSGAGYTITGNTIGFANTGGTGTTNMVGNSVALTGTFPSSYTTTGTANATRYIAINCAFTAAGAVSSVSNNTIGGFAHYTSSGATTTNGVWCGINLTSGNANIGSNTIGSTSGQGSIYTACTTSGGVAVGIYATSVNTVTISGNSIGGIDASGTTATTSGTINGIDCAGAAGVITITGNTIGNSTADNLRTGYFLAAGSLSNAGSFTVTTGTSPVIYIRNTSTGSSTITYNTLRGLAIGGGAAGTVTGIIASGATTISNTIFLNSLGTAGLGLVRYNYANSGALTGISALGTAAAAPLRISYNDFQGIVHSVNGTNAHTYITFQHGASVADSINGNTWTNLNVATSGAVTFINRGTTGNMTATGKEFVQNNAIVTAFNKPLGIGTVTIYTVGGGGSAVSGSTMTQTGNNFSNITLTGATPLTLWSNSEGAGAANGPTKLISNNTFNNITTGAAQITGIGWSFTPGTTVSNNTISNITSSGVILAISSGTSISGTQEISGNTLTNFTTIAQVNALQVGATTTAATINVFNNTVKAITTSTAASPVFGIIATGGIAGTVTNIYKNKVTDITSNFAGASTVTGILAQTLGTYNIYNNLVGDLKTPTSTSLIAVTGISIGAAITANVYNNTVQLNATSTSVTTFGTSCITFSSTTTAFNSQNNILKNTSVPAQEGSNLAANGVSAGLRRTTGTAAVVPTNYSTSSNKNAYWVNPSAGTNNHLTYVEGTTAVVTNPMNTLAQMKSFMSNRDGASVEENVNFRSLTGTDPNYLKVDTTIATQLESGAGIIASPSITNDYYDIARFPNAGYPDNPLTPASAPDIGANEFGGILQDVSGPGITYTALGNTIVGANQTLTATITDASGVPTAGAGLPVLYWNLNGGAYTGVQGTSIGSNQYTFTFGSATTAPGDVIGYYIVAQDNVVPTPNISASPAGGAAGFTFSPPAAATPPTTPSTFTAVGTLAGNKTVGAGGDYATLQLAFADINAKVVNGDLNLLIQSGGTTETAVAQLNAVSYNGAAHWNITVKPDAAVTATITSNQATPILLNGADYVIIDGSNNGTTSRDLTINTTSISVGSVIWMQNTAGNDAATNNTVKNCNIAGNSNTTTFYGVGVGSSTISLTSRGNLNINNSILNNNISKAQYGIYTSGLNATTKSTGTVISNNLINTVTPNNISLGGIFVNFESGITISGNNVAEINSSTTTAFGISLGAIPANTYTAFTGQECVGATVSNNIVNNILRTGDGSSIGIMLADVTTPASATNTIVNNSVSAIRTTSATPSDFPAGIVVGGGTGSSTNVYYNSVSLTGLLATSTGPSYCLIVGGTNPIVNIRNNALYNDQTSITPGASSKKFAIATSSAIFSNMTIDYNILRTPGTDGTFAITGGVGPLVGTYRTTLAAWQTATGKDAHSLSDTIPFTSQTDLTIDATSSYAWNISGMGTPISTVSTDILGGVRSTTVAGGSTDLGAYNVTPSSTPPSAVGSPVAPPPGGGLQTFTLGGKLVGSILWGATGTNPTSINFQFFPGANPPNSTGFNVGNGYYVITVPDGTGFTYDITLNYDPSQMGTIPADTNVIIAKSENGGSTYEAYLVYGPGPGEYERNSAQHLIVLHGLTAFSLFALGDNDAPLPVELSSFTATTDKRNVNLNWSTVSELNNTGFDVERRLANTTSWTKVGNVAGNGTSNSAHSYSFKDMNVQTGKYNYRLKQIDVNGTFTYHQLSSLVDVGIPTKFDISQNYPNPFNPSTKINYDLPFDSKVSIKLFDMTGREVAVIVNATQTAGYYTAQFNGSNLASGVYFYNIIAEGGNAAKFVTTKKMVLVK